MTEFLGARISLISKSNIRYVGILHEINSEKSTVALEQVISHGTEGRRGDPAQEIAGSDNIYEYIVFRGSDVKDLRIEEQPKPQPPPQLDDPAILGQSSRPPPFPPQRPQFQGQPPPPMAPPYFYPPPHQQQRFPPSPYQQGMYGAYPPPAGGQPPMGQPMPGMPPPPPPPPPQQQQQQPQVAPQQQQPSSQAPPPQSQPQQPPQAPTGPQNRAPPQAPIGPAASRQVPSANRGAAVPPTAKNDEQPATAANIPKPAEVKAAPQVHPKTDETNNVTGSPVQATSTQQASRVPTGPKSRGGIVPALPLTSPARPIPATPNVAPKSTENQAPVAASADAAIQDMTSRVNRLAVKSDSLPADASQVNSTPTPATATPAGTHQTRAPRQPGTGGNFQSRGGRANHRGAAQAQQNRKVEIPTTDYDFESANAIFNKQDLVKEVIASEEDGISRTEVAVPNGGEQVNGDAATDEAVVIPPAPPGGFYNRGSSFFDNISCENKERAEAKAGERRGGAQFRSEEQKKNLETFGQGSVDGYSGYRGGWKGRARGRGYGRGRGGSYNYGGRGSYRGQQGQQGQQQQAS